MAEAASQYSAWSHLVENSAIAIAVVDGSGRVTLANRLARRLLGLGHSSAGDDGWVGSPLPRQDIYGRPLPSALSEAALAGRDATAAPPRLLAKPLCETSPAWTAATISTPDGQVLGTLLVGYPAAEPDNAGHPAVSAAATRKLSASLRHRPGESDCVDQGGPDIHAEQAGEKPVADAQPSQQQSRRARQELERRVAERTAELAQANQRLMEEIAERERAQEALLQMAAELERSNAELQQFAYVASHDLQEPLRMITSYLQLFMRRYGNNLDGEAREFLEFAVDGATRMQKLISDLLAYSRVHTRARPPEPTDSAAVLQQTIQDLQAAITDSNATVTFDELPMVMADATQLGQLFQNLISNAIKYRSDDPPRIHISAHREGDQWVFAVKDNGIGIDPKYFDRIFAIFQRLHTRDEYPGTGIGLAICKRIVERHGGRIWVESAPGQGCTFFFTLPARLPEHARTDAAAA